MEDPPADDRRSAPYTLGRLLHAGPSSLLFLARKAADGSPVIVKTLADEHRPSDAERIRNEYGICSRLDLPGVMKALELWSYRGRPALVMEYFDGGSLHREAKFPLDTGRFLEIACLITGILAKIHGKKVIHKDIKPDNILYSARTGEVRITDFGISSPLASHRPRKEAVIEGSLPYMSPEQTGRIDRALDQRSDLYSLGVTFYEMLTGTYPFEGKDPLEWAHCHIARIPPPPRERVASIPEPLSSLVMKLLAKDPEDRYQSAGGLLIDLQECRSQVAASGTVKPFALGWRDFSEGLRIPRRLYGREKEATELKAALKHVVDGGGPELVTVSGYSGVGKSALVEVLRRNSIAAQGMFVAGKFDQYHRDIPYSTLVEAFSGAVVQILAAGEERNADWKARLQAALGVNGRLMIQVIPQLESIIGPQPAVPELSPAEAKNRFRMVMRQFIGEFAKQDHPLVLFLDDMQWADPASLELIFDLAGSEDLRQLLIACAYRDNEVGPSHPLTISLEEAGKRGVKPRNIVLAALSEANLLALLTDALRPPSGSLPQLAALVHEKTGGNPFFAIQFLLALNEEGLVKPDANGAWTWDMAAIRTKGFTENVIDLMAERLHRLSPEALDAMRHFACLGAKSSSGDLARVLALDEDATHVRMAEIMEAGLVISTFGTYAFLHDRVQEAAYSFIPPELRPEWHLRIGRRLKESRSREEIEEGVFLIASQLNRGIKLIRDEGEKEELLRLDALAASKAKASVAYDTARSCYAHAISLLPEDAWRSRYREWFSLSFELSECEFLLGNFDRAEELALALLDKAEFLSDRAAIFELRMRCHQLAGKFDRALALSLEGLRMFGKDWSGQEEEIMAEVGRGLEEVQGLMSGRSIESILDAPMAEEPEVRSLISLLVGTMPSSYYVKPALFPLVVLEAVIQSLRHGNVEDSCIAYCCYAVIIQDDVDSGFRFSEMSLRLNEKLGDSKRRSAVLYLHAAPHNYRKRPFATSFPMFERGFVAGLETGDLLHASYNAMQHVIQAMESGMPFDQFLRLTARYREFTRRSHNLVMERNIQIAEQTVAALQGKTRSATSYDDDAYSEEEALELFRKTGFSPSVACHHIWKQMLAVIHGQFEESLGHAARVRPMLMAVRCLPLEASYHFHHALALAGQFVRLQPGQRKEAAEELDGERRWLEKAARHCPANYGSRHLLVCAEMARIEEREVDAMRLFEQAAEAAEANGLTLDEALVSETASRFFRVRNLERLADYHLGLSRSAYRRLGASGKVRLIDIHYPRLRKEKVLGRDTPFEADTRQLDLLSVTKASQAISGEVLLDSLLRKMMAAMLEQAGAQWGCMLLRRKERFLPAAEATLGPGGSVSVTLLEGEGKAARALPQSILDFTARNKKRVLLENAALDPTFSVDAYVAKAKPRSVLCLPIMRQGEPSGLLYLENNLLSGAFTPDKLEVLELMASQSAISLENAGLYEGLRREYSERKQVEEQLRHSQKMDALGTLAAGIAHDFNNLLNVINGYSEFALMRLEADHPLFESLGEILKSGERAAGLTRQLLAYSRKQATSPQLWNLNDIVFEMESLLRRLIGDSVAMTVDLAPAAGRVRADRGQVEQVLMNLIVNARDAMPNGGHLELKTASVELGADFCVAHPGMAPGPHVMLSVRDDGTGMTPEVKSKLFEPFFTTKEPGKGTGLGLAVVYGIVNQSGGCIEVESELGRGTTFRMHLPRADAAEESEDGEAKEEAGPRARGEVIALVEDEDSMRKFTAQALESMGYRVRPFANGKEALAAFETPGFAAHLVISDLAMPDMGGRELAERLRKLRPKLPVLFISGYADHPDSPYSTRGETLLRKPFSVAEILSRVRGLLQVAA